MSAYAESTLSGFERLRADVVWRPVIAALDEHAWTSTDKKYAEQFQQELASVGKGRYKLLPTALVRRLQACFSTLVGFDLIAMLLWVAAYWSCIGVHAWTSVLALQTVDGDLGCFLHCMTRVAVAGLGGVVMRIA